MTQEEFNKVVEERIENIRKSLVIKGNEYSLTQDRLSHFKEARGLLGTNASSAQVAWSYLTKHLMSIRDCIEANAKTGKKFSKALIEEKIQDYLNYGLLIYAIALEEMISEEDK